MARKQSRVRMHHYAVSAPTDYKNPIPEELREGKLLVYHGTNAKYATSIEGAGFKPHTLPYDMEDVRRVRELYDLLGWPGEGGYCNVLNHFSSGIGGVYEKLKPVYFAFNYEKARDYATNQGGETIVAILDAMRELEGYCSDKSVRERFLKKLADDLENEFYPPERQRISARIQRTNDVSNIPRVQAEVTNFTQKYDSIAKSHIPVIYAVEAQEEWFNKKPKMLENDLRSTVLIPPEKIFARIDFPNSAVRVPISVSEYEGSSSYFNKRPLSFNKDSPK